MPGSIRVSVFETYDLPEAVSDGDEVVIKVVVGSREFQTEPVKANEGKTEAWGSDFVFPVLNLRDSLLVILLTKNGEIISKNEIDTPSIVEKGSFEVNLLLNGGGYVHLSLSFVLTDEERRRIDIMRAAALKRRAQEASKTASTDSAESKYYSTSSDADSAATQEDESGAVHVSPPTVPQAESEGRSHKSGDIWQDTHKEATTGVQIAGGDPDAKAHGGNERNGTGISDVRIGPSTNGIPSVAGTSAKLEEQTAADNNGESHGGVLEENNADPSSSGVQAKIKAFETTKPLAVFKQGHIPSTVEMHASSSKAGTSPTKGMDKEGEQGAPEEGVDHKAVRRKEENERKGAERNLEPGSTNTKHVEGKESNARREKTLAPVPKRRRKNIDIMSFSKQVLTGVVIGAVSAALLIAARTFLLAPNKRRNTRLHQKRGGSKDHTQRP